jgi:speckle-type POZ protein
MMLGIGYYIRDDRLTIECQLTVIGNSRLSVSTVEYYSEIDVTPCDIMDPFGKLLSQKEGTDQTIVVAGRTFEAHKIVQRDRPQSSRQSFWGS